MDGRGRMVGQGVRQRIVLMRVEELVMLAAPKQEAAVSLWSEAELL